MKKERIVLGSGKLYIKEFDGIMPDLETIVETMALPENLLGKIKGGASVEYKPTFVKEKDDLGTVAITILTDEEVILKSGIMTWNGVTLETICSTARVEEVGNKRIVKIGGIGNYSGKMYVMLFVYTHPQDGQIGVAIVGNNQAGFSFAFDKEKSTVIDVEFNAQPQDDEGTLIALIEDINDLATLTVSLDTGSSAGKTKINTVLPTTESSNSLKYKIGTTAENVSYEQVCTTGWTAVTIGTTEISATAGQVITVVEVDSANKAKKYGTVTVIDNIA